MIEYPADAISALSCGEIGLAARPVFDQFIVNYTASTGRKALSPGEEQTRPVYDEPTYAEEEECYVRHERVLVPGWGWELRRRTICH